MEPFFNHKMIHFSNNIREKINKYNKEITHSQSKLLVIIACHLDKEIKLTTLLNNFNLLKNENIDFIIIYSKNQIFNEKLYSYKFENTKIIEFDNNFLFDFGKWKHVLNSENISSYQFITFTNDSFYLKNNISYYFNYLLFNKPDFFAFSSSNEYIYHYQTYLFTIKKDKINIFRNFIETFKNNNCHNLLTKIEISLGIIFVSKDCFVDLGHLDINNKKNIFFHNKVLYKYLYSNDILPIIKIKSLNRKTKIFNNIFI
jgi:hypothetical protein